MYRDIRGFEGYYQVNENGEVFSIRRRKKLKHAFARRGYLKVRLQKDGLDKTLLVHRLVADAFIPNPEALPHVNHKDGNRENNQVSNLEWCTSKENVRHAWKTGLMDSAREKFKKRMLGTKGDLSYATKLSDKTIQEIRDFAATHPRKKNQYTDGFTASELAEKYGVCKTHMQLILTGDRR